MVVPLEALRRCALSAAQLELLVGGTPEVNVKALQRQSICSKGLGPASPVVVWFWEWLQRAPNRQRQALLEFATGCPRMPLDGFDPPFNLQGTTEGADSLPRAHTCFHHLMLPQYESAAVLAEKVEYALAHAAGAGFQFS